MTIRTIKTFLIVSSLAIAPNVYAGTILTADGKTDTYTLINDALGGTAVEVPDCSDPIFGAHIRQEFDADLGKPSFVFILHVRPDNDRCINTDRQRVELKTYGGSPDALKGFNDDTLTYRWKFKLDSGFKPSPSFTHIHQIKAGDGDADMPIITLTLRTGNPDKLELIHVDSSGTRTVLRTVDLAPFKGKWIDAYEKLTATTHGKYSLTLTRAPDGEVLFSYRSDDIDLWRIGTSFVRPKWGIYRSLNNASYLRNEAVGFDGFCLAKGNEDCPPQIADFSLGAMPGARRRTVGNAK
jgi:hypothetical protein